MRKTIINTNNKEIYDKLTLLNFTNEVVLINVKINYINKILNNINRNNKVIDSELVGDYIVLKKRSPINFNVYLK